MVRILKKEMPMLMGEPVNTCSAFYIEAAGLSTDTKPTDNVLTGSLFIEVDTAASFFFDEDSGDWIEIGGENNG